MIRRSGTAGLVLLALAAVVAACGSDDGSGGGDAQGRVADIVSIVDSGEFTEDGADLFNRNCASCHGGRGQGGIGPALGGGEVADKYPDVGDHVLVILAGRGGMPSFATSLDDAETAALINYTRNELGND